jgi:DNA-binding MurR/RpiR family transcriptional regulator
MSLGFASYPNGGLVDFVNKLGSVLPTLPKQEAKIAQFMLLNLNTLGPETGKSLAKRVGVAEITVGRLMRRLGYKGTKDLKNLLRQHYAVGGNTDIPKHDLTPHLKQVLEAEISIIRNVFDQTNTGAWDLAVSLISDSSRIYVTGFQTVRGLAEDFSRRLSLVRDDVRYLSPHDGMLGEWLLPKLHMAENECIVVVDVVPYASEAQELVRIAKEQGRNCIVVSDEFCHWARDIADAVLYAPSNTGLFLESTIGLSMVLGLLMDSTANANADLSRKRLAQWKKTARRLNLF